MMWLTYLFGLLWLLVAASWAQPFLTWWLNDLEREQRAWLMPPLTFGLSVGGLSLLVFVVGFWQFNAATVLTISGLVLVGGVLITKQRLMIIDSRRVFGSLWLTPFRLQNFHLVIFLLTFILVLAHATYYPFIGDDEISRYAYYGKLIWWRGQITPDVRGYPMLMSSLYAATFAVTNPVYSLTSQLAEQLAKIIPVLFSALTVWATAALGQRWFGRVGGIASALMLIITPLYLRWSPDGYVDIPSALYFVLGAYAADVWLEKQNLRWALMAGALTGFSLWTKQSGFAMLPTLGLIFLWGLIKYKRWSIIRDGLLVLAVAFICGGWWYARNIFYEGWLNALPTPGDFYTLQARATLLNLIPFVGLPQDFGVAASAVYTVGLIWALIRVRRTFWLLGWALPYTLLWWQSFSYDARFLLTVLPFYALAVGGAVGEFRETPLQKIKDSRLAHVALAVVILFGWGMSVREASLGGGRQWLTAPAASYAERLIRVKGDLYPAVQFIQAYVPPSARLLSMDGRFPYYLVDRPIDVYYASTASQIYQYDYVIVGSWWILTYDQLGISWRELVTLVNQRHLLQLVFTGSSNNLQIFKVMKP